MHDHLVRKYFYLALFLLTGFFAVLILWPLAKIIIVSIVLATVLFPVYLFFMRRFKLSWLAALATTIIFVGVLVIPLFFIGSTIFTQSQNLYAWVVEHGGFDSIATTLAQSVERFFPGSAVDLKGNIAGMTSQITSSIGATFAATLSTFFAATLVVLSVFYFLKDGIRWKQTLLKLSPLSDEGGAQIIAKLTMAVNGIVKGYLLVAIIQGVLMGIGLRLFGVPNAALWGVVAGMASLIPTIGTALVSVPAILFLLILGKTGAGVGLLIWALVLVGTIDNLLNPLFVGRKIEIHPLLVLFSVLGGIALMGPIGILIGPLTISCLYALVSVYKNEMGVS